MLVIRSFRAFLCIVVISGCDSPPVGTLDRGKEIVASAADGPLYNRHIAVFENSQGFHVASPDPGTERLLQEMKITRNGPVLYCGKINSSLGRPFLVLVSIPIRDREVFYYGIPISVTYFYRGLNGDIEKFSEQRPTLSARRGGPRRNEELIIFSAVTKPNDLSRISVVYSVGGKEGCLEGYIDEANRVQFEYVSGPGLSVEKALQ